MSVTCHHVSINEKDRLHEKLASTFRVAGLKGNALDAAIEAALTPSLIAIETSRRSEVDRRSKLKVVKD